MSLEEVKRLQEEEERRLEEFNKLLDTFFEPCIADLFKKFPELQHFSWRQYTAYFNDGDPCSFGVRAEEYGLYINGLDWEEWEEFDWMEDAHNKISDTVYAFDNDFLEKKFGDHVEVTCHREGHIDVEPYIEHD